jgi:hypothetical protein
MPAFTEQQKTIIKQQLETLLINAPKVDPWHMEKKTPTKRLAIIKAHTGMPVLVSVHIPGTKCSLKVQYNTYSIGKLMQRLRLPKTTYNHHIK